MNHAILNSPMLVSGCADRASYDTQLLYFTCSSLDKNDRYLYMLSDRNGHPNVIVKDLRTGEENILTNNQNGILKSYVYFSDDPHLGLSKASVSLDCLNNAVYFIQDNQICRTDLSGKVTVLNTIPNDRVTAFTHVSADGRLLCVPMTDGRCLDYDPKTEGSGLDLRPIYNIDQRIQEENLNSYLCVYETETGHQLYEKRIPKCWITHVQFNPKNPDQIMYNNEWTSFDCGIRRMWLYDRKNDSYRQLRTEGNDTLGNTRGYDRSRNDWICHEMWCDDGNAVIYHGGYANGPALVGRYELTSDKYWEIALPDEYDAYGHFTMDHAGNLCCDGYYRYPGEVKRVFDNSTDNGPDPHKKDAEYICKVIPDWNTGTLNWVPLCKHESDWLGQDAHPHPIYSHSGDRIFFNSRSGKTVNVYCVSATSPQNR